jgi:hypothetical protein
MWSLNFFLCFRRIVCNLKKGLLGKSFFGCWLLLSGEAVSVISVFNELSSFWHSVSKKEEGGMLLRLCYKSSYSEKRLASMVKDSI